MTETEFDTGPILEGLNDRQREAVQTTKGPVLVVAGPGSGKTCVLTRRIAWILANKIARPSQVMALTFTNKAAKEMRERVQELLPRGMTKKMWMGTFHAMMARLLRIEAEHIGYTSDFTIYDTDDSERLLKQIIDEHGYDPKQIKPRTVRNYISGAKNAGLSAQDMEKSAKSKQAKAASRLYDPYNEALSAANAFDFDDLLLKPLELFKQCPDVLNKYQERWSHVLIDEYQDTNHVQYRLAYALSGGHRNLCIVGDDAQSIYSFRGADIQNILSFEKDFEEAKVIRLEQNYRSTEKILKAADSVIFHNSGQIKKKLWTENAGGSPVTVISARDDRDEASLASNIIRHAMARGSLRYRDFAILYRTNVQSRTFEEALRRDGIPYIVIGGLSFYQRKEIKDAIAYLQLLVNPNDIASFQRIVNYPARGIGVKSQQKIAQYSRQEGYDLMRAFEEIKYLPIPLRARNSLQSFVDIIRSHAERVEAGSNSNDASTVLLDEAGDIREAKDIGGQTHVQDSPGDLVDIIRSHAERFELEDAPSEVITSLFREAGLILEDGVEEMEEPSHSQNSRGDQADTIHPERFEAEEDSSDTAMPLFREVGPTHKAEVKEIEVLPHPQAPPPQKSLADIIRSHLERSKAGEDSCEVAVSFFREVGPILKATEIQVPSSSQNSSGDLADTIRGDPERAEAGENSSDNAESFFRKAGPISEDGVKETELLPHSQDIPREDPSDVAASLFRELGLIRELEADETPSGQSRLENVHELLRGIQDYFFADKSHTLSSYLQEVSLMTDADKDEDNRDRVFLMTLHASKGLEFDTVFIGGMEEGLLPLIREETISPEDLEEERRLLYVGITRAKSRLYLAWARARSRYGGIPNYPEPSRFIEEIDPEVLTTLSASSSGWRSFGQPNRSFPTSRNLQAGQSNRGNKRNQVSVSKSSRRTTGKKFRAQDPSKFKVGRRVRHEKHGLGEVLWVEGKGETTTVIVDFGERGQMKFRLKYAPMQIVE